MADYTPVYLPGNTITLITSGAVVGGDVLVVSGSGTVAKAAAANARNVIGKAAHDAALGARVAIFGRGTVHESVAEATVTAGDQIGTSAVAGRQVVTVAPALVSATPTKAEIETAVNNARAVLGVALTTAADAAKVRWMEV